MVAIFSIWANQQLLDTGSWVSVSNRLLKSKEVRHRVADFLGEELVDETEAQLLAAGRRRNRRTGDAAAARARAPSWPNG